MCEKGSPELPRESLAGLLQGEGVVGVSQLRIFPSFADETICTLAYTAKEARIGVIDGTFRGSIVRHLPALKSFGPLASWNRLRAAAFAAPSCSTLTCDGVAYRHAILDWQGGTEASWSNPTFPAHPQQCQLASAYRSLIDASGLLLNPGCRVRIRTGLMAGFVGRVEFLDRHEGRLRVVAQLAGKPVSLDLGVSDIEFALE
jgi:hypothetical protein